MSQPLGITDGKFLKVLNIKLPWPRKYPRELKYMSTQETCTLMFLETVFIAAKSNKTTNKLFNVIFIRLF